jgi:hypothetical protein
VDEQAYNLTEVEMLVFSLVLVKRQWADAPCIPYVKKYNAQTSLDRYRHVLPPHLQAFSLKRINF